MSWELNKMKFEMSLKPRKMPKRKKGGSILWSWQEKLRPDYSKWPRRFRPKREITI